MKMVSEILEENKDKFCEIFVKNEYNKYDSLLIQQGYGKRLLISLKMPKMLLNKMVKEENIKNYENLVKITVVL